MCSVSDSDTLFLCSFNNVDDVILKISHAGSFEVEITNMTMEEVQDKMTEEYAATDESVYNNFYSGKVR